MKVLVVVLTNDRVRVDVHAELFEQKVDVGVKSVLATFRQQNHQRSAVGNEIFHALQFDFVELLLWPSENEQADGLQSIAGDFVFVAEKEDVCLLKRSGKLAIEFYISVL